MSLDIVVFGEDWGGLPSSTQHITRRLIERGHRILWINSIGLRRPRLSDAGRVATKLKAAFRRRSKLDPSRSGPQPSAIVNPLVPPVPTTRLERGLTRAILGGQIRRAMARLGMRRPLLWASLPSASVMLGACDERGVVYYCGDDFGDLVGVDHAPVLAMERALAERADLVLAASPILARRFDPSRTTMLSHGVDYDLFSSPVSRPLDLVGDRPTAGFYGSIADWLDRDLMAAVATRMPDWNFQFIGSVNCDLGPLSNLPNVRFLGPAPHHALPSYVQHWTAALLPFRDTAQIRACNPLKLREYLAAGASIVSTPFPAAEAYQDIIRIARSPDDFAAAIAASRSDTSRERFDRRARVANETWAARAATVEQLLCELHGE